MIPRPSLLFKYRGNFRRDLNALVDDYIYAAEPKTLNDPFEITIGDGVEVRALDLLADRVRSRRTIDLSPAPTSSFESTVNIFIDKVRSWGIYSLASSPNDELSWSHYADGHQGFCIAYDVTQLCEQSLRQEKFLQVEYRSEPPQIDADCLLHLEDTEQVDQLLRTIAATKAKCWQHEGEWRVITGTPGKKRYDYRAVHEIYFGLRMSHSRRKCIMKRLQGRGILYYQMARAPHSYRLSSEVVIDPFLDAPPYMISPAPVENFDPCIDPGVSKRTDLQALVHKAIEIVRHDPYCAKVTDALITENPDEPGEPIFHITYQERKFRDGPAGFLKDFPLSSDEIEGRWESLRARLPQ